MLRPIEARGQVAVMWMLIEFIGNELIVRQSPREGFFLTTDRHLQADC